MLRIRVTYMFFSNGQLEGKANPLRRPQGMASTQPTEQNGDGGTDLSVPFNQPRPILIIVMVRACPDFLAVVGAFGYLCMFRVQLHGELLAFEQCNSCWSRVNQNTSKFASDFARNRQLTRLSAVNPQSVVISPTLSLCLFWTVTPFILNRILTR